MIELVKNIKFMCAKKFENDFENDMLGCTGIIWLRLSPKLKVPDDNKNGGNVKAHG